MTSAEKAYYIIHPPTDDATTDGHQVMQTDTNAGAAKNSNLWSALQTAGFRPEGKTFVTFEALTADMFVRFKRTASAAATTSSNGLRIAAGTQKVFWLDPTKHLFVDTLGSAAGSIKWYVSSPPMELSRAHETVATGP